jgi:hypothetical protein
MGEKWDDREFEDIAQLIREDEEQALEIFRQRNFDQKVRARIEEFPETKGFGFFSRRALIPAAVTALVLILAGAVLLIRHRPVRDVDKGSDRFAAVLAGLPGFSELAVRRGAPRPGEADVPGVTQSIRDVLASAELEEAKEAGKAPPPASSLKVSRLSLQRTMRILFEERVIERVLVSLQKKSKEV